MSLEFDQMYEGSNFIHPSGEHLRHLCCDCGRGHNIKLTVVNAEDISVEYFANQPLTKEARKMGANGRIISQRMYPVLIALMEATKGKERKRLLKQLKEEYVASRYFLTEVENGEVL